MTHAVQVLQGAPPLKFAIFFAGALIRDRNLSYIYKEKVTLPSIHIIGDKDYVKEVCCTLRPGFVNLATSPTGSITPTDTLLPCNECC